ncbi:DNA repair protein RadC [uncultured Alistipes sp.]|uniref:RadC family protein n=1 Tax=uncultured Alistipes sp. TaxID=538949 RepID=UPI002634FD2D|nr:DNA repair protein RadC [uncultured Alistipes sp.]
MKRLLDKLAARGPAALDDAELLALLLGEGSEYKPAEMLSKRLLEHYNGSLARLGRDALPRLRMVEGVGLRRAARIVAAAELGRRILTLQAAEKTSIQTSDDVIQLFRPELELLQHEECWALYLSSSNRIIERQRVSQGGVQGTIVDHRLIVKRALELLATQLILVHNHPSGSAEASDADRHLTSRIAEAAALFDIRLLDHIIISRSDDFSFRSAGLLG